MAEQSNLPPIILASGSRYRAGLLRRLRLDFTVQPADIDESAHPNETGLALAERLSLEKARHVHAQNPTALVIGADQVAVVEAKANAESEQPATGHELILGKPGNIETARAQMQAMRGHSVVYHSGMAIMHGSNEQLAVISTRTRVRDLSDKEIESYLNIDQPWDCAGALRSESLGISLLEALSSDDPTALIGLPLIRLSQWLRQLGYAVP